MRLDHFVLFNNHLTTTTKGDNMSKPLETPSITRSIGYAPSESVWIEMKKTALIGTGKRVYGRIQANDVNYIVEGWNMNKEWVRIPCRRLQDAQMLIAKVMRKSTFDVVRLHQ